ncbi:uncharacterized protein [Acropora muricata]|uniref:uncharacterized protein isoform X2 n=1 Tax=Acropora muricata TaxID=159855 RepID=UPI0034E3DE61
MFSLQDISTGCLEIESLSNKGDCDEDDSLSIHSDGQTDNMSEEFPLDNKVTLRLKMGEDKTTENCDTTTRSNVDSHDRVSINRQADTRVSEYNSRVKLTKDNMSSSSEAAGEQLMKVYTIASKLHENESHEALCSPSATFSLERKMNPRELDREVYASDVTSRHIAQPTRLIEGCLDNQTSIYQTVSFVPMVSTRAFVPFQDINAYNDTHRSLTSYEMSLQRKPGCNCPCHISTSPHVLASEVKIQRPSVIMVPAKRDDKISDASSKVDAVAPRPYMLKQANLPSVQRHEIHELGESDSSDDDEDGEREKYFRVSLDGTTARFKLTKEDWERIPINTFPSGGRLLSGDWTRIFLQKVKESNPWCSLRFKNNHVRSENSRKIHSAVFFRGGAECKRPECNVKVRFVIRKEMGKHVDVTYVGNVCHSANPGGSDVSSARKRRQVHSSRSPSYLHGSG